MIGPYSHLKGTSPISDENGDITNYRPHPKDDGGYIFSLSTLAGGRRGYPIPGLGRGYPISGLGRGVSHPRSRWGYPISDLGRGVPHPRSRCGVPHLRSG